jgi:hypothetical protein
MLNDRELLSAHVEALFTQDAAGRLLRVNEPGGKVAPRFFLGRTAHGNQCWFRDDVHDETQRRLKDISATVPEGLDREEVDEARARFEAVLQRVLPIESTWSGPAFRFSDGPPARSLSIPVTRANADVLRPHLEGWCEDVEQGRTVFAVVVDHRAVSVCASVRETPIAHEAGVETAGPFRGHGYAGHAVSGWAKAVGNQNRVPLYSTSWTNTASLAVARKLKLVQFAWDLHIS